MATTTPVRKYLKMNAATAYTGLSADTLRELVALGELPAYRATQKPGAAYLFKIADLDALMKPVMPAAISAARA
ncbi:helix-turn-helix domain-containing protein [Mycolicibacterium sp. 22603]|uniref:helix-turn-helix domain-containing protein n=1 Tax=Mycolicibacterium sp. 22603 TaxID=3453950 RepID=UPI003F871B4A